MINDTAKVSVIVRSMARPALQEALASIASQDYPCVEVVVVAACGSGHPPLPDTCGSFPMLLVKSASRLPRPAAANVGLEHATGEWITFLDDDDVFLPGHISGLMAARPGLQQVGLVHSYARCIFKDGSAILVGQPHALIQLYERNYISLSTAVFARELVTQGCRFDESLDILEDWDFVLQLAQRTQFHFVPLNSFSYHIEAGDSGLGKGGNQDNSRFISYRDRIQAKWAAARSALAGRVMPYLQLARTLAQKGRWDEAEEKCRAALELSPNDPWALNVLAMIKHGKKDIREARAIQELAAAIRPLDARFVYDLAVLYATPLPETKRDHENGRLDDLALLSIRQGELNNARRCCERALSLDPGLVQAQRLQDELTSVPVRPGRN